MEEMMEYTYEDSDNERIDDDADYSDVESTTSEKSESPEEEYEYVVLSPSEIVQHMSDIVEEANSVLQLPSSTARMLLNHLNWDKDDLLKRFFDDDQDQLFREANVINPFEQISSTANDDEECSICYEVHASAHMKGLGCGHSFCEECWTEYLTKKIVDEGVGQSIVCPAFKCPILVDYETVMRLVEDANVKDKYQSLINTGFIESNRLTRWCPSTDCEYAIKMEHIEFAPVECKSGHTFCFLCGENWHDPVNCSMLKEWLKKCNEDSGTSMWMSKNTKMCPKCKATIEKDGGCNKMVCKRNSCNYQFCWVCLGPWEIHGNDFKCNSYVDEQSQRARNFQERKRAALNRYVFFLERYLNHQRSLKLEHILQSSMESKMEEMQKYDAFINVEFLKEAVDVLRKCRQTLMYTYVFAYHLEKSNQSLIFEGNQNDLERATELLSEYLERDQITKENLKEFRRKVQDACSYCERRRKALLEHVHEGNDKNWW